MWRLNVQLALWNDFERTPASQREDRGGGNGDVELIFFIPASPVQRAYLISYYYYFKTLFLWGIVDARQTPERHCYRNVPQPAADQTATMKIACLNVGPSSLIYCEYDEVSQTHCLEEQLHTCSQAHSIILKNRPSLSPTVQLTVTFFYDLLIYKTLKKNKVQGSGIHSQNMTTYR